MKTLLTSTAIALLIANGTFAQTDSTTESDTSTATESDTSTDSETSTVDEMQETVPAGDETATEGDSTTEEGAMSDDAAMADDGTMTEGDAAAETDPMAQDESTMGETDAAGSDTMTDDGTMADDGSMSDDTMTTDEASTDTGTISPMEGYSEMTSGDVVIEDIQGAAVYGGDMNELGNINDFVVNAEGEVTDVIIDVGGFLGIGEKPVALAYDTVTIMQQDDGEDIRVFVQETEDQLEEMEEYSPEM